jgi:tripartite-type tricarboxylate transporter receptor subunit TctC
LTPRSVAFAETGVDPVTTTPEQFAEVMRRDYEKYGRIIKAANIKVD